MELLHLLRQTAHDESDTSAASTCVTQEAHVLFPKKPRTNAWVCKQESLALSILALFSAPNWQQFRQDSAARLEALRRLTSTSLCPNALFVQHTTAKGHRSLQIRSIFIKSPYCHEPQAPASFQTPRMHAPSTVEHGYVEVWLDHNESKAAKEISSPRSLPFDPDFFNVSMPPRRQAEEFISAGKFELLGRVGALTLLGVPLCHWPGWQTNSTAYTLKQTTVHAMHFILQCIYIQTCPFA